METFAPIASLITLYCKPCDASANERHELLSGRAAAEFTNSVVNAVQI